MSHLEALSKEITEKYGLQLSLSGIQEVEKHEKSKSSEMAGEWLLDQDLRNKRTEPVLPTGINNMKQDSTTRNSCVQIISVANLSQPSYNQENNSFPRLLSIKVTDGHTKCNLLEFSPIKSISLSKTCPGQKLMIHAGAPIRNGFILLSEDNVTFLGGDVEVLRKRWMEKNQAAELRKMESTVANELDQSGPSKISGPEQHQQTRKFVSRHNPPPFVILTPQQAAAAAKASAKQNRSKPEQKKLPKVKQTKPKTDSTPVAIESKPPSVQRARLGQSQLDASSNTGSITDPDPANRLTHRKGRHERYQPDENQIFIHQPAQVCMLPELLEWNKLRDLCGASGQAVDTVPARLFTMLTGVTVCDGLLMLGVRDSDGNEMSFKTTEQVSRDLLQFDVLVVNAGKKSKSTSQQFLLNSNMLTQQMILDLDVRLKDDGCEVTVTSISDASGGASDVKSSNMSVGSSRGSRRGRGGRGGRASRGGSRRGRGGASSGSRGGVASGNRGGAASGNRGGAASGNRGGAASGNRGGAASGNRGGAASGNRGGSASGSRGGVASGNRGGSASGNRGGAASGNRGGAASGNRGGAASGNRGGAASGNRGGAASGNRGGAASGNRGGAASGNRGGAASGNRGGAASGNRGGTASGNRGRGAKANRSGGKPNKGDTTSNKDGSSAKKASGRGGRGGKRTSKPNSS